MGVDSKSNSSSTKENEVGGDVGGAKRRSSLGGLSLQSKSLIPVPVTSPPKGIENCGPEGLVEQKTRRRPFGVIQNSDSPRVGKVGEKAAVASSSKISESKDPKKKSSLRKSAIITSAVDASTGTSPVVGKSRLSTGVPNTPQNSPSKLKGKKPTGRQGIEKDTVGEDSIGYWKELAESRRQALEDALRENMDLHERIEELTKENAQLEELVEEAKQLAEMVNTVTDDVSLDESGIGDTINVISAN